jgi:hypothetical protein
VRSTSAVHRARSAHHDCQPFIAHFIVGTSSQGTDASARCLAPRNVLSWHAATTPRTRPLPSPPSSPGHRTCARRTDRRLIWQRERSNRHSTPPPLTSSARPRGFLPRGLPNPCPSDSTRFDSCAHAGRSRTILNVIGSKAFTGDNRLIALWSEPLRCDVKSTAGLKCSLHVKPQTPFSVF